MCSLKEDSAVIVRYHPTQAGTTAPLWNRHNKGKTTAFREHTQRESAAMGNGIFGVRIDIGGSKCDSIHYPIPTLLEYSISVTKSSYLFT